MIINLTATEVQLIDCALALHAVCNDMTIDTHIPDTILTCIGDVASNTTGFSGKEFADMIISITLGAITYDSTHGTIETSHLKMGGNIIKQLRKSINILLSHTVDTVLSHSARGTMDRDSELIINFAAGLAAELTGYDECRITNLIHGIINGDVAHDIEAGTVCYRDPKVR